MWQLDRYQYGPAPQLLSQSSALPRPGPEPNPPPSSASAPPSPPPTTPNFARQPILTERLLLRAFTPEDTAFHELRTQPEVMHWTAAGVPDKDVAASQAKLDPFLPRGIQRPAEAKGGQSFYGYLFTKSKPIPAPTPLLDALLRAIAAHIASEIGDKNETHLTPAKLSSFYKIGGHDFDYFFVDMPPAAISTVYQGLGCQHLLLPSDDDFAAPSVPALTVKGFVRWQTIQTLLGPQTQVPVLQYAAANWSLKHPENGAALPTDLPKKAFPSDIDPDTDRWHRECADRSRMKAAEEEPAEPPKETPKPEFTDRKVPYTHVRVGPSAPRDYFATRPVNDALPSENGHGSEILISATLPQGEESTQRRRSFSDYSHSPHDSPRSVRVPHLVPEHDSQRRRHSHPRHYSSASDSDAPPISPRASPRRAQRSNGPPPITVRRVYTNSSEDGPRVVRSTMPMHSPRPENGRGAPRDEDPKRRSALFGDFKEKITNFISPGAGAERARSASGSRGSGLQQGAGRT
ncbi:hypothetical protein N0V88_006396 [Collariella sp. IMI 366227]|nr:hypothetical protein N0V88_006396 [Collariella sp. IMI 366227]